MKCGSEAGLFDVTMTLFNKYMSILRAEVAELQKSMQLVEQPLQ